MELEIKTTYLLRVTLLVKQYLLSLPGRKICALACRVLRGKLQTPEPPQTHRADLGLGLRDLVTHQGGFPSHMSSSHV